MLSEIGLFPGQDQVLSALSVQDGMTMGEVAALLRIRPPTASKMAARMGAQGLVERRSAASDARLVTIHITDDGRALCERIERIARKIEKQMLSGFDDKDERRLRRLLKKVSRNLGSAAEGAEAEDADEAEQEAAGAAQ
jgi:MarR family transcriptional regulator, organic hydroperoxide resistance regulator